MFDTKYLFNGGIPTIVVWWLFAFKTKLNQEKCWYNGDSMIFSGIYTQKKDHYNKNLMANATTWCWISMNFPKIQNLTSGKLDSCEKSF